MSETGPAYRALVQTNAALAEAVKRHDLLTGVNSLTEAMRRHDIAWERARVGLLAGAKSSVLANNTSAVAAFEAMRKQYALTELQPTGITALLKDHPVFTQRAVPSLADMIKNNPAFRVQTSGVSDMIKTLTALRPTATRGLADALRYVQRTDPATLVEDLAAVGEGDADSAAAEAERRGLTVAAWIALQWVVWFITYVAVLGGEKYIEQGHGHHLLKTFLQVLEEIQADYAAPVPIAGLAKTAFKARVPRPEDAGD